MNMYTNDYRKPRPRDNNSFQSTNSLRETYPPNNQQVSADEENDSWNKPHNKNIWGNGFSLLAPSQPNSSANGLSSFPEAKPVESRPLSASHAKPFVPGGGDFWSNATPAALSSGIGSASRSSGVSSTAQQSQSTIGASRPSNLGTNGQLPSLAVPRAQYEQAPGFLTQRQPDHPLNHGSYGVSTGLDSSSRITERDDSRWSHSAPGRSPIDAVLSPNDTFSQATGDATHDRRLVSSRNGKEPFMSQFDAFSKLTSKSGPSLNPYPNGRPQAGRHNSYEETSPTAPIQRAFVDNKFDAFASTSRPTSSSTRNLGPYSNQYEPSRYAGIGRMSYNNAEEVQPDPYQFPQQSINKYNEQLNSRSQQFDQSPPSTHYSRNSPPYHTSFASSPADYPNHQRGDSWQSQSNALVVERRKGNYPSQHQYQTYPPQMVFSPQMQHMFMHQMRNPYGPYGNMYYPQSPGFPMNGMMPPMSIPPMPNPNYPMLPSSQQPNPPREPQIDMQSQLLREYRLTANKRDRKWELKEIYGHIVEFSGDQIGSRFLQTKIVEANSDEKAIVFGEIRDNAIQLMQDVFGNYVIQKFFEHGDQGQKKWLGDAMRHRIADLSVQMYGCRVVQKAFEFVLSDQQALLVAELNRPALVDKLLNCQHGNHVIQKAIEVVSLPHVKFIYDILWKHIWNWSKHVYGCRVIQRMLEQRDQEVRRKVLAELRESGDELISDTYGNYVAQHVIREGDMENRNWMINMVLTKMETFGRHKFASNVVEKAVEYGTDDQRREILRKVMQVRPDEDPSTSGVLGYLKDQYGNYVIQTLLRYLPEPEAMYLSRQLIPILSEARKCQSKKVMDGVEALLKYSTTTSPRTTPRSSLDCSNTQNNTNPGLALTSSSTPASENSPTTETPFHPSNIAFGTFPEDPTADPKREPLPTPTPTPTAASTHNDGVNQLSTMLRHTSIADTDQNRTPHVNGYRP